MPRPDAEAPLSSLRHLPPHNLPASLTPFVGRASETAYLVERLQNPTFRLLTIVRPGGIGKTRLALKVAHAFLDTELPSPIFPHGVVFVALAPLVPGESLEDSLATMIAAAIGLPLTGADSPVGQVGQYLCSKTMLLVLDNFEHVLASALFLPMLLQAAPSLNILVTSRARLNIRGEGVVELTGLPVPQHDQADAVSGLEQYSALQLFVQTAQSLAPDFAWTAETAPTVVRICRLVEGLPLGIELAAAWARLLSCSEIADELASSLDFLAGTAQNVPDRQKSLRAVFTSSWNLLSPTEQQLLARLAIFQGSFSREAAEKICDASLPLLASLLDKSLIRRVARAPREPVQYELPRMLRQYAAERLAAAQEMPSLASQHAAYYLTLLHKHTTVLRGSQQQDVLARITAEIDEVRAA